MDRDVEDLSTAEASHKVLAGRYRAPAYWAENHIPDPTLACTEEQYAEQLAAARGEALHPGAWLLPNAPNQGAKRQIVKKPVVPGLGENQPSRKRAELQATDAYFRAQDISRAIHAGFGGGRR